MKWILPLVALMAATPTLVSAGDAAAAPTSWSGQHSGVSKSDQVVVRSAESFAPLWQRIHRTVEPKPAVPNVDFDKSIVVAVFMGSRSSGGYSVQIGDPEVKNGKLIVPVHQKLPGGGPQTQVMTSPWTVRVLPVEDPNIEVTFKSKIALPRR
ncbi:protease complex subunit PrcB family protein [Sulfuriroseicoccus oceanibius]|uniref:Protease complex subunit PrcB family protein n=1 Tax=Sulfuriroseicoccus oceanibius TaxID=2707525 RepID=A0A6B3LFA0_9BACT|nr:protease complex subunit PrcB family protein [Sulfuriroseicoccus oceanibius]QQL45894.1 protease complex subunit PrcB family protein [Sulfuriroseicoccus oceanibius]